MSDLVLYDTVIVGAGAAGLTAAYELVRRGQTNVQHSGSLAPVGWSRPQGRHDSVCRLSAWISGGAGFTKTTTAVRIAVCSKRL
jgi:glycine/D-amino acid oxidase-like deaminating enzyme